MVLGVPMLKHLRVLHVWSHYFNDMTLSAVQVPSYDKLPNAIVKFHCIKFYI